MGDSISITSGALTATIAHHGAELQSLRDSDGHEHMSNGDPTYWSGRAPLLFPIVGRLNHDQLRLGDSRYTMLKHGFARKSDFSLIEHKADSARFCLGDNATTRSQYPFAFTLEADFHLAGKTLQMCVTARNDDGHDLPFSFGYHPAFAWPLPGGGARSDHRICFEVDEPAPLCRLTPEGHIQPDLIPSPVGGNQLALADTLFDHDALIWKSLASRRLSYGAPGHRSLDIAFPDTEWLGIWTKVGASFICIEPWAGSADPDGYYGDFTRKPGIMLLAPQEERRFRMDVTLVT